MKSLKITEEAHAVVAKNAGHKQMRSKQVESLTIVASEMIIFADRMSYIVPVEFENRRKKK